MEIDLKAKGLLEPTKEEAPETPTNDDDIIEYIGNTIEALNGSMASLHVGLRTMSTRLDVLEKFTSYLLSQDPKAGEKFKEMARLQEEAAAKGAAEE